MKKINKLILIAFSVLLFAGCSSSKNAAGTKISPGKLAGEWTLTDISVEMPSEYKVTDLFDEASPQDFENSVWDLKRNGKGSYTLANGTSRQIHWSIQGKGENAQFQFKKLMGEKARDVEEGYRMDIDFLDDNTFVTKASVGAGSGNPGHITYVFTK